MNALSCVETLVHRSALFAGVLALTTLSFGQERIQSMPGYAAYSEMRAKRSNACRYGRLSVTWSDDGTKFSAQHAGKVETYHLASKTWTNGGLEAISQAGHGRVEPARGRQFDSISSPDGKSRAICRERNVVLSMADGQEVAVTTDGSESSRVKYGAASWVYGEELDQREAMWFSPDGKKLAFYRFDESKALDYYLTLSQTTVQDQLNAEAYPKAGAPNPIADVLVYDLATKRTTQLKVRFGEPEMGHYIYSVRWSPDGTELLFFRQNRKENRMEVCAGNPETGECRTILEERNPNGWVPYQPGSDWTETGEIPLFLPDRKLIWVSERSGFRNAYLYDLSGRLICPLTQNQFDLQRLLLVDPKGRLWYTAHNGSYPSQIELHRVNLDGTGDVTLTDIKLSHSVEVSPAGNAFVDVAEALDVLPVTRLCTADGVVVQVLMRSDASQAVQIGLKPVERVEFLAADGVTKLYGYLAKPTHFDPSKRYPLLVSVYGGPESSGTQDAYVEPDPLTDFGFLIAWFDGRGTFGRGRAFLDAVYRKLGVVDIDDQAAGVKALAKRPYVDAKHVGIYGTSYGGYASLMALLRYPSVFQAAAASSPVTDWHNYDSTYTERYMGLPEENEAGYRRGSALTYVMNKRGHLLIYFGTADNNVHPSNTIQLVNALNREGKGYEMVLGPDEEHSGVDDMRMMEFFIDHLVLGR